MFSRNQTSFSLWIYRSPNVKLKKNLRFFLACINFYVASKTCYSQAIAEYANIKSIMLQHGHTVSYNFNHDSTISESVKDMVAQKFTTVVDTENEAQTNENIGNALLRGIHRKDVTNANRISITPSITEMRVGKSAWNLVNGS